MMKRVTILAVALTLAAGAAWSRPIEVADQDVRDIQCMALVAMLAGAAAPEQQEGLAAGMMYYLGRLEGRDPDADWLTRMVDYLRTPGAEQQLQAERQRCGQELVAKGQTIMDWGAALKSETGAAGN